MENDVATPGANVAIVDSVSNVRQHSLGAVTAGQAMAVVNRILRKEDDTKVGVAAFSSSI